MKIKKPSLKIRKHKKFNLFKGRFSDKNLLKKILYTLLLILIFRIGASITTPGISVANSFGQDQGSLIDIIDLMGGGALKRFSIFALGISPYITASIIMTMLQSEVFPPLYRLSKSGSTGRRKIQVITRVLTLVFAIVQAITILQTVEKTNFITLIPSLQKAWFKFFIIPLILVAGSLFSLFLGEQITSNGVGNGTSLIIFSGIAARFPAKIRNAWNELVGKSWHNQSFLGLMNFMVYILVILFLIFIIGYLYKAERHVPIQQTGAGLTTDIKHMSRLPIKLNPAGVMPVIFAYTVSALPLTVAQFLDRQSFSRQWIENNLRLSQPLGLTILILVNFFFTIIMSLVTFNPLRISENFKKNGTFIPGIRPGDETENYLSSIVIRLGFFSAFYLSAVVLVQYIEQIAGLSAGITMSGTSLIIMVSVAIETVAQLKARDQTSKIARAKIQSTAKKSQKSKIGDLLW